MPTRQVVRERQPNHADDLALSNEERSVEHADNGQETKSLRNERVGTEIRSAAGFSDVHPFTIQTTQAVPTA